MAEISIIIPAYNAEAYLAQTIESVIDQTFQQWQLIIIDDGSHDTTMIIAEQYAQHDARIQAHTQINSGVAVTRNNGLKLIGAEVRYVLFLDNDDYLEPDALMVLRSCLLHFPDAVAVYGLPREVNAQGDTITHTLNEALGFKRPTISSTQKLLPLTPEAPDSFTNLLIWPSIATPGQVLIRVSILMQVGAFDPETVPSDDWDLWIRLSLYGSIQRIMRFTINKRSHASNVSKKGKTMAVAEPRIRRKLATATFLTAEQKQTARLGHWYSCWYKLSWSKEEFQRKDFISVGKTIYRAIKSYAAYLQTI